MNLKSLALPVILGLSLLLTACSGDAVAPTPTPLPVPDCQAHNTGILILQNKATDLTPRDAILDGLNIGTIAWGGEIRRDVAAGVAHTVFFRRTSNGAVTTSTSTPIVAQCGTSTIFTSFDIGRTL